MGVFTKYWVFQLAGWSFFAFFNIYIAFLTKEINTSVVIINLLLSITGFFLTHLYRNKLVQKKWFVFSTEKLLVAVFLACLLITIIYLLVYYSLAFFLFEQLFNQLVVKNIVGSFVAVFLLFAIWNAIYFAWNYIERNRQIQITQLQLESSMKDLEIQTIRANLQPHFIFNSLNSIRALIDENPLLARDAITKISAILRNSISKQEPLDTLENEIKIVESYLDLEKIRFEERLHFTTKIAPNTLEIMIPTMMLQTLVENAIKHGISMLEKGGVVLIETFKQKNELVIKIQNTGKLILHNTHTESLGFGIKSSKERLLYLFGSNASLTLEEIENNVVVTVKIPSL